MARSNNFQVRVTGDTTKFDAAMRKAQGELRGFGDAAKKAFTVVGITSFTAAIAGLAKTIGDFERANSELAAVLGTNIKGIEALTKSAKELGRTSEFTASEVTKLQISLSRLGFDQNQIQQMQGSILNFALAMGTDLASAADFTGAALRAFGLEAKDTGALLDVMSAATTNSALDFSKLQASISTVAPIAKSFGLDAKETATFLGVLSNNGFDASSAATALRNILLNLSDANGKLSKGIGHSAKSFDEIIDAFKELHAKGVDVGAVLEMTDKRSAAAAITLISQADAAMTLKAKLDDSQGSLQTMADTMHDNLNGAVKGLQSAWEGFVLALEGSKGPMKDVVDGLTDILNRITDIISKKDEVTWWEAILGPITGGLIASRQKKNAGDPLGGGGGSAGAAEGGGGRVNSYGQADQNIQNPQPVKPDPKVEQERKKAESILKRAEDSAKSEIQLLSEKYDEERAMLERYGLDASALWDEYTKNVKKLLDVNIPDLKKVELEIDVDDIDMSDIDAELQANIDATLEQMQRYQPIVDELNNQLTDLVTNMASAFGQLFADLATGEDAWGNLTNAALSAFADMAIAVGKIAISTGMASEAIQEALKLDNPYVAIAAGVALVALGTAVKAGLSNVAAGNYSASTNMATNTSSSFSADYDQRDVYVNVTGTLQADGDQLVAVISNTEKKKRITT